MQPFSEFQAQTFVCLCKRPAGSRKANARSFQAAGRPTNLFLKLGKTQSHIANFIVRMDNHWQEDKLGLRCFEVAGSEGAHGASEISQSPFDQMIRGPGNLDRRSRNRSR